MSEFPFEKLPGVPKAAVLYLTAFPKLAPFFTAPPDTEHNWASLAAHNADRRADPALVSDVLVDQNKRFGADHETLENAAKLAAPDALAVVTGQQVGYFGGPAYTLYKALTCVALARHISEQTGRSCVPVFYLVAEDHDLEEIRHAWILDSNHQLHDLQFDAPKPPCPACEAMVPSDVEQDIARLTELLPESEHREKVLQILEQAYRPGQALQEAFSRWMLALLSRLGVVILDPSDPRLKLLARDLFVWEIENHSPSTNAVFEASRALTELGVTPQIHLKEQRLNLFYLDNGRHAIHMRGNSLVAPAAGKQWTPNELKVLASTQPDKLSPNVVLRPLFQDVLLPTVAYVAGPAEISYFAQLGPVYRAFGMCMPVIWPRASFTLITPAVNRYLRNLNLDPRQIVQQGIRRKELPLDDETVSKVRRAVAQMESAVLAGWPELVTALTLLDPSLEGFAEKSRNRIVHVLREIESKAVQAKRRRDDTLSRQLAAIENTMLPHGKPQERVVNAVSFLARSGLELTERLLDEISLDTFAHKILVL